MLTVVMDGKIDIFEQENVFKKSWNFFRVDFFFFRNFLIFFGFDDRLESGESARRTTKEFVKTVGVEPSKSASHLQSTCSFASALKLD
jgi:hypothetical protein